MIEAVGQASPSTEADSEQLLSEVGPEKDLVPEADFAPLLSWDPLADVGWHATETGSEFEVEGRSGSGDGSGAGPGADPAGFTPSQLPVATDVSAPEDEFASKLEAIAAAIRREKVEDLLAENPHDALTALVAGYYLGSVRRRGGAAG